MTYPETQERDSGSGRLGMVAVLLCIAFLAFVAGSFLMYRGVFPASALRPAFQAAVALHDRLTGYQDPVQTDFWTDARTDARGVLRHDPTRARQGMTLYTSGHEQRAVLMDMDGRVVHDWALPYSAAWEEGSAVRRPRPDAFIHIEKAHVFPNGDLLALYTAIGDTPWGYGLVKMDAESNVIWKYLGHAHHDFDIDDEGNIYVLTHEISYEDLPGYFGGLHKPRIDEFIVKLSHEGQELKKFWLMGAFAASPFGRRLYFVPWHVHDGNGDYLHANSIHVVREPVPGIPRSRPGQLLVSLREISTIALADMEEDSVVWAMSGSWVRQHDAQFLSNGNILLFDNEGDPSGYGVSRVMEFDPATHGVVWSYQGNEDDPLDSVMRSTQSRLDNGNTLVVESMAGRLIEVTREGEIVWEFVNPVRGGDNDSRVPVIFWVQRLDPESYFTPEFRKRLRTAQ